MYFGDVPIMKFAFQTVPDGVPFTTSTDIPVLASSRETEETVSTAQESGSQITQASTIAA